MAPEVSLRAYKRVSRTGRVLEVDKRFENW